MKRILCSAFAGILLLGIMGSCEEEPLTIGDKILGEEPFFSGKVEYDVFVYNNKIEAVPTNRLPIYQLGLFKDPVYGNTVASVTTQVNLAGNQGNPIFGNYTQLREETDDSAIPENERITSVRLYLPYFINNDSDSDNDGVIDGIDKDDDDPNNDNDDDGLSNLQETSRGTDPLNPDTDGDGILDGDDEQTVTNSFPARRALDSIYGDLDTDFNLRIHRSTYFLNDLDPNSGFQEAAPNYSNLQITPDFVSDLLYEGDMRVSDEEIVFLQEDDPETEEVDESLLVDERLQPGILVELDSAFFQNNLIDLEGEPELLSNANFREFFRGLNITLTPENEKELLILFDLTQARLTVSYEFDALDDDEIVTRESQYELRLLTGGGNQPISGNAVNTQINDDYPPDISDAMVTDENASRIYLKGGAGTYAEIDLFDTMGGGDIINQIKQENWIINAAYLTFYVDRERLDASGDVIEPPRLFVFNTETLEPLFNILTERNVENTPFGTFLNYDGFLEKEGDQGTKYRVNIAEHINNIILRDSINVRLGMTITPDLRLNGTDEVLSQAGGATEEKELPVQAAISPLGTVLIGSNTEPDDPRRLRLEIFYTEIDP